MKKERKYPFCKAEKNDSAPVTEDVYAGPEFFGVRSAPDSEPEEAPPVPDSDITSSENAEKQENGPGEEKKDSPEPPKGGFAPYPGPPPQTFMCVYAGPEFFSGRQGPPAGAYTPPQQDVYSKYCPTCGTPAYKKAKFCTECGYVFLKEDSRLCPYCGASNLKTSKFCSECGSRFVDAENV